MLGIEDPFVWLAYVLSIASAILCGIYGAISWNRSDEPVAPEDVQWAAHEVQSEQES